MHLLNSLLPGPTKTSGSTISPSPSPHYPRPPERSGRVPHPESPNRRTSDFKQEYPATVEEAYQSDNSVRESAGDSVLYQAESLPSEDGRASHALCNLALNLDNVEATLAALERKIGPALSEDGSGFALGDRLRPVGESLLTQVVMYQADRADTILHRLESLLLRIEF